MSVTRESEGVDPVVESGPILPEEHREVAAWIEARKNDPARQETLKAAMETIGRIKPHRPRSLVRMTTKGQGPGSPKTWEPGVPTYEQRLDQNPEWAMSEGSRHFERNSAVFDALRKIADRLKSIDIPYAVIGGMALFQHGYRRYTEDIDILVTKSDLKTIHEKFEGLGYLPPHRYSKHLRDTELGVKIEFLTTGEYPGDGKEKPVSFPDPRGLSIEIEGVSYLNLEKLIELKIASGMTNVGRLRDLSDVMELIKVLNLSAEFGSQLNPFVRKKYKELWKRTRMTYRTIWRNKWLTAEAKTLDEMIASLRHAADTLDAMRKDGVALEPDGVADDYAHLVTTDPEIAKKYDMVDEMEFWGDDEEEGGDQDGGVDGASGPEMIPD